jgi:hypothetical protein
MHVQLLVHASQVIKNESKSQNARTIARTCVSEVLVGAGVWKGVRVALERGMGAGARYGVLVGAGGCWWHDTGVGGLS